MKERTCLLIEYTSAPLPLTVPIARYPLPRDVSLTLSFRSRLSLSLSPPLFTALRPVTSHNRPVDARVYAYSSYFNYSYTSYSSSRAPPSPSTSAPFPSPNRLRASIHLLPSPHSFQTFLSLRALPHPRPPPAVPRSCPRTLTQAPNPTAVSLALCLLGRGVR